MVIQQASPGPTSVNLGSACVWSALSRTEGILGVCNSKSPWAGLKTTSVRSLQPRLGTCIIGPVVAAYRPKNQLINYIYLRLFYDRPSQAPWDSLHACPPARPLELSLSARHHG